MALKGFQRRIDKIALFFDRLISKFHRSYLVLVCLFALTGYAFVFLFPALAYLSFNHMLEIFLDDVVIDWQLFLIWFVAFLISIQLSYRMLVTRPVPAVGFTMPESKIPKIYSLVKEMQSHFKRPVIHRIIISVNYELDIVKTPRWILPIWSSNTLVIGLPLLICLSPEQFEYLLARKTGQFSRRNNILTNWLYQLNGIWQQYSYIYGKQKTSESRILKLFYSVYASLYERISVNAAIADELYADEYVMELYSHEAVCEMITADALCRWYLEKRFWPVIEKASLQKTNTVLQPYRKLTTAIRSNLTSVKIAMLKKLVWNEPVERANRIPSIKLRLDKIGYAAPQMEESTGESAADFYLGASLNGALNLMDKLWLKNNRQKLKMKKMTRRKWVPVLKNS